MRKLIVNSQGKALVVNGAALAYKLPEGYTEVEYLENQGTALIDTGISGLCTWYFTAQEITLTSASMVVACTDSASGHWCGALTSNNKWGVGSSSGTPYNTSFDITTKADIELEFAANKNITLTIGEETVTRTAPNWRTGNVHFFGCPDKPTQYPFKGRIFGEVVCIQNGKKVFIGTPCRNSQGVAGWFNIVSGTFFPSITSTDLIAGPDAPRWPVQLVKNGNFANGTTGWRIYNNNTSYGTMSVSNGVLTYTIKSVRSNSYAQTIQQINIGATQGNKCYVVGSIYLSKRSSVQNGYVGGSNPHVYEAGWNKMTEIVTSGSGSSIMWGLSNPSNYDYAVDDIYKLKNLMVIDLTATYGAGNEPTLEQCQLIFGQDYYEYYNPNE